MFYKLGSLINLMKINSVFDNEEKIPMKYTADGENVNPEITITEIPDSAKGLTLIVEDSDAEKVIGHTFYHWVVFDIPIHSLTVTIKENSLPGNPGESTYKKKEYGGPSPPKGNGIHHYHFRVYATNKMLELPSMVPINEILKKIENTKVASAELVGIYSRE